MASNENRVEKKGRDFDSIHNNFVKNLENLKLFVNNLTPIALKHDKRFKDNLENAGKKLAKICGIPLQADTNKSQVKLKLTEKKKNQIESLLRKIPQLASRSIIPANTELLYKSSFVILISHFDFLISDLIRYYHRTYPDNLSGKEVSISFNELKAFDDIPEVLDYLINKEVEKILYSNLEDQKKYFKTYLKVDLKESIIPWNRINEATERRHIIVHNNDIINRRYLKNADVSAMPSETTPQLKEGQKIGIGRDYLLTIFDEIFLAGIILIQSCWRKWKKDSIANADDILIQTIYEALSEERWPIAQRLGLYSKECEVSNEQKRLYLDINYCQSLKWSGNGEQLIKELEKFDITSLRPIYLVAYYALKSDIKSFYKRVPDAIMIDNMDLNKFLEWPLFREFRKDPNYHKTIRTLLRSSKRKKAKVILHEESKPTPSQAEDLPAN